MSAVQNTPVGDDVSASASVARSRHLLAWRGSDVTRHHPLLICEVVDTVAGARADTPGARGAPGDGSGRGSSGRPRDGSSGAASAQRAQIAAPLRLLLNTHADVTHARKSARGFAQGCAWSVPGGRCEIARALMEAASHASQPLTRSVHRAVAAELCLAHPQLLDELLRQVAPPEQWTEASVDKVRVAVRIVPHRRVFGVVRAAIQAAIDGTLACIAVAAVEEVGRRASDGGWPEARELLRDVERLTVCGANGSGCGCGCLTRGERMRAMNAVEQIQTAGSQRPPRGRSGGSKSRRRH